MDISQIIFLVIAAVTLISAVLVVTIRHLVHAALWLIVTLFTVAALFVLLEAGFLAVVQVVLYIGAIAVLILIAMMLTRKAMSDELAQANSQWQISLVVVAAAFIGLAGLLNMNASAWPALTTMDLTGSVRQLGLALVRPDEFVLPFEVASVLLIIALVGAIAVAGEKK